MIYKQRLFFLKYRWILIKGLNLFLEVFEISINKN